MILYEFLYCSCIYESSYQTMSLHKTKWGAYLAMRKFIESNYASWYDRRILYGKNKWLAEKFGETERWKVSPIKVLE